AAGLVALEKTPPLLARDHQNAKTLAEGLAGIPGISIDPGQVETNILVFDVSGTGLDATEISAQLKERGVLASAISPQAMRMVTHYDVSEAGIERAVAAMDQIVQAAKPA
ncbi:MAG: low specificity L-threonine aldolase, partial [Candidatus Acidiferrales bacterium]